MTIDRLYDIFGPSSRIILIMYEHGAMTISTLREVSKISVTVIYNALKKLLEAGLIVEERESTFPWRRLIKLTDRGRMVAEYLVKVEEVLSSR